MSVIASPVAASPLSSLPRDIREHIITVLTAQLSNADAAQILAALAGTRDEVMAVPMAIQVQAQRAILGALPPGTSVIAVSKLGLPTKTDQDYLEEVLTDEEKADPVFRQRVEEEARSRHIQRWLVAVRLRGEGKSPEEYMSILEAGARRMAARKG